MIFLIDGYLLSLGFTKSDVDSNLVFQDRLKHVEIKYKYIRDMVQRNAIQLRYLRTDD